MEKKELQSIMLSLGKSIADDESFKIGVTDELFIEAIDYSKGVIFHIGGNAEYSWLDIEAGSYRQTMISFPTEHKRTIRIHGLIRTTNEVLEFMRETSAKYKG